MEDEEVKSPISRRRIMKRAGVGAAIVWSAPVLSSLGAAHAQGATPAPGETCGCPTEGPSTCINTGAVECPETEQSFSCFCWTRAEGGRVCGTFASNSTCNTDAECGPGEACVVCEGTNCPCGETGRACSPICEGCVAGAGGAGGAANPPL